MAAKVLSARVPEELAAWLDEYAKERGVTRADVVDQALRSFQEDCRAGVPDLKAKIAAVQAASRSAALAALQGVGNCPKRPGELGHVWGGVKATGDGTNPCSFCGTAGRQARDANGQPVGPEGFFEQATRERVELFSRIGAPDSVKGVKSKDRK